MSLLSVIIKDGDGADINVLPYTFVFTLHMKGQNDGGNRCRISSVYRQGEVKSVSFSVCSESVEMGWQGRQCFKILETFPIFGCRSHLQEKDK